MFEVKICGVMNSSDAEMVAAAGPDAVGLNFSPGSPRCISVEVACQIDAVLPSELARVAVVVNATLERIRELYDHLRLDYLQLHGDESPAFVGELRQQFPSLPVIRAFRCREGQGDLQLVQRFARECSESGAELAALLLDAFQPGQYGGTGKTVDWEAVSHRSPELRQTPLVLAGGLRPENVAEAIRLAEPSAVDTASGVESSVGRKDPELVRAFVERARQALATNAQRR